jgi:hypothetical protein
LITQGKPLQPGNVPKCKLSDIEKRLSEPFPTKKDFRLQQFSKLFFSQSGLFNYCFHQTAIQITAMLRHRCSKSVRMFQSQMAATVFVFNKTRAFERADESHRVHLRQPGQAILGTRTGTGIANPFLTRFSTGNGRPSLNRLARWHSIESRTIDVTSSRLSPWEKQPGNAGTSAQ